MKPIQILASVALSSVITQAALALSCPTATSLSFQQFNPQIKNGVCIITANTNGQNFISNNAPTPGDPAHTVPHPIGPGIGGSVTNAQFQGSTGTSCLYRYLNFRGNFYNLIMSPTN